MLKIDKHASDAMSDATDQLILLAQHDAALQPVALKFQIEVAASRAAFQQQQLPPRSSSSMGSSSSSGVGHHHDGAKTVGGGVGVAMMPGGGDGRSSSGMLMMGSSQHSSSSQRRSPRANSVEQQQFIAHGTNGGGHFPTSPTTEVAAPFPNGGSSPSAPLAPSSEGAVQQQFTAQSASPMTEAVVIAPASNHHHPAAPSPQQQLALEHLIDSLKRMVDLACECSKYVLARAQKLSREWSGTNNLSAGSRESSTEGVGAASAGGRGTSPAMEKQHVIMSPTSAPSHLNWDHAPVDRSSYDELHAQPHFSDHTEFISHASYYALQVLTNAFLVSHDARGPLQAYITEEKKDLLQYLNDAMNVERKVELSFFAEGFKTAHMNVLANLTYQCHDGAEAISEKPELLINILAATRIDPENPGMLEWAEFCIRNMCEASEVAKERIRTAAPANPNVATQHAKIAAHVVGGMNSAS